ncbi:MAG: hypothetical protein ACE5IR_09400 [bacterium]
MLDRKLEKCGIKKPLSEGVPAERVDSGSVPNNPGETPSGSNFELFGQEYKKTVGKPKNAQAPIPRVRFWT